MPSPYAWPGAGGPWGCGPGGFGFPGFFFSQSSTTVNGRPVGPGCGSPWGPWGGGPCGPCCKMGPTGCICPEGVECRGPCCGATGATGSTGSTGASGGSSGGSGTREAAGKSLLLAELEKKRAAIRAAHAAADSGYGRLQPYQTSAATLQTTATERLAETREREETYGIGGCNSCCNRMPKPGETVQALYADDFLIELFFCEETQQWVPYHVDSLEGQWYADDCADKCRHGLGHPNLPLVIAPGQAGGCGCCGTCEAAPPPAPTGAPPPLCGAPGCGYGCGACCEPAPPPPDAQGMAYPVYCDHSGPFVLLPFAAGGATLSAPAVPTAAAVASAAASADKGVIQVNTPTVFKVETPPPPPKQTRVGEVPVSPIPAVYPPPNPNGPQPRCVYPEDAAAILRQNENAAAAVCPPCPACPEISVEEAAELALKELGALLSERR